MSHIERLHLRHDVWKATCLRWSILHCSVSFHAPPCAVTIVLPQYDLSQTPSMTSEQVRFESNYQGLAARSAHWGCWFTVTNKPVQRRLAFFGYVLKLVSEHPWNTNQPKSIPIYFFLTYTFSMWRFLSYPLEVQHTPWKYIIPKRKGSSSKHPLFRGYIYICLSYIYICVKLRGCKDMMFLSLPFRFGRSHVTYLNRLPHRSMNPNWGPVLCGRLSKFLGHGGGC